MKRISSLAIALGVTALLGGTALAQSSDYDDDFDEFGETTDDDDVDVDVDVDVEPDPMTEPSPDPMAQPRQQPQQQPQAATERETTTVVVQPQPEAEPESDEYEVRSAVGINVMVGGGLTGFIKDQTTDYTDLGGAWEARVAVGTKYPFSVEAAYLGGAQDVDALGLEDGAILLGNGAELGARVNVLSGMTPVQPFLTAGAAWKRYDITNSDFNTSNLNDEENVLEIPVGAGIGFTAGPLLLDLRGTYRPAFFDDMTRTGEDDIDEDSATDLDNWRASLNAGFAF